MIFTGIIHSKYQKKMETFLNTPDIQHFLILIRKRLEYMETAVL